jgi:thioredoxin
MSIDFINTNIEKFCLIDNIILNIFVSQKKTDMNSTKIIINLAASILMVSAMAFVSPDAACKTKDKKMETINLTTKDFNAKVSDLKNSTWKYLGDKPAIIDFYASWCVHCRALAPTLEDIASEYKGKVYVYKVDTDAEEQLAQAFGIRSIPTLIFVPMNGTPVVVNGAIPKSQFEEQIKNVLKVK